MIITTTENFVKIQYANQVFAHPINSISYALNADTSGLTLFRNHETICTSPLVNVLINGQTPTADNIDALLGSVFATHQQEEVDLSGYLQKNTTDSQGNINVKGESFTYNGENIITQSDMDELTVGGRNYILNSAHLSLHLTDIVNKDCRTPYQLSDDFVKNCRGREVTISADIEAIFRSKTAVYHYGVDIRIQYTDGTSSWVSLVKDIGIPDSLIIPRKRYSATIKIEDKEIDLIDNQNIFIYNVDIQKYIIENISIEIASKSSDWLLAPEDSFKFEKDLQIGGINYLKNSRFDSLKNWNNYGGNAELVTDSKFGNVVQWNRISGTGEYQRYMEFDDTPLLNTNVVLSVIAKQLTNNPDDTFHFGMWRDNRHLHLKESNKIDLGDGWCQYWTTFNSENSLTDIGAFGIHSVMGSWQFYGAKVERGTRPTDWSPAAEDIQIAVSFSSEEQYTGKKWIDGKKLYQKTIAIPTLSNAERMEIPHGINNMDRLVDIQGTYWSRQGMYGVTSGSSDTNASNNVSLHASVSLVIIHPQGDATLFNDNYVTLYYTCSDR